MVSNTRDTHRYYQCRRPGLEPGSEDGAHTWESASSGTAPCQSWGWLGSMREIQAGS